jgi:hypothetical protein
MPTFANVAVPMIMIYEPLLLVALVPIVLVEAW